MNSVFDSLKLTLFEIVGYILPGVFVEMIVCLFLPSGVSAFSDHLPILLLLSYPLGQLLHSSSSILDISVRDLPWRIYHLIKEKDENGHGVKHPRTRIGKLAMSYRAFLEKHRKKKETDDVDQILRSQFGLDKMEGLDLFFLKESILAESDNIATNFEHLHYQRIFNRSVAFIFACLTVFFLVTPLLGITTIHFSETESFGIGNNHLLLTLASAILFVLFRNRVAFFKNYREKIMNSAVRLYLQEQSAKKRDVRLFRHQNVLKDKKDQA